MTRSNEENQKLKEQIDQDLFEVARWDLIKYSHTEKQRLLLEEILKDTKVTDIIITSKYAASLINQIKRVINFWVVGQTSAKILEDKGGNIRYIAKNASDLIENLQVFKFNQVIYLSANKITMAMHQEIRRLIIYNVEYKNILTNQEIDVAQNGVEYILLYSQNCAKILVKLLLQHDLTNILHNAKIIAISPKVADIVKFYCKDTIYCPDENYDQMLKLLNDAK